MPINITCANKNSTPYNKTKNEFTDLKFTESKNIVIIIAK